MFYKIEENEDGNVVDATCKKFLLIECNKAQSPKGTNVGYTEFPTRASALAFYGVTEIPVEELFPQAEVE